MNEPQSPFDEPAGATDPPARNFSLPPRKWSFVALGLVLFVLVWVREFTGLLPSITIATAVLVLLVWGVVHVLLYTTLPERLAENEHRSGRSGTELANPLPRRSSRAVPAATMLGLIGGIWLQGTLPLPPMLLTIIVMVVAGLLVGSLLIASRL